MQKGPLGSLILKQIGTSYFGRSTRQISLVVASIGHYQQETYRQSKKSGDAGANAFIALDWEQDRRRR
jgi:hypothetical protein